MPRRNNRPAGTDDFAPAGELRIVQRVDRRQWLEEAEYRDCKARGFARWRETDKRQTAARISGRLDWDVCIVPGCAESTLTPTVSYGRTREYDHTRELPFCSTHLAIAWSQMQRLRGHPELIQTVEALNAKARADAEAKEAREQAAFLARTDGQIYFIRLNDLIKVGWSRDIRGRLKSYGASAQLLCHYPATRDDETTLHRQLRPALAKGREWYHPGDVIDLFLTRALEQHGPPTVSAYWTKPKEPAVRQHRRR